MCVMCYGADDHCFATLFTFYIRREESSDTIDMKLRSMYVLRKERHTTGPDLNNESNLLYSLTKKNKNFGQSLTLILVLNVYTTYYST